MRGRDIKRYGYEFADKWLIATFPAKHYDIDNYPAIKKYLLSFGMERLEQTGKKYVINGETITARKKTNNKWFETQDQIGYWEDFSKQKIVWGEISDKTKFALDYEGHYYNEATTFYLVGENLKYLLCALNAKISEWQFSRIGTTTGVGTVRWKKYTIGQLLLPHISDNEAKKFSTIVDQMQSEGSFLEKEDEINRLIFGVYGLTQEEINFIESI